MLSSLDVLENKMIFFSSVSFQWSGQTDKYTLKKKKDLTVCILSEKIQAR